MTVSPDEGQPVETRLFPWVQALRAVAAGSVAFLHIANDAMIGGRDPTGLIAAAAGSMPWAAGVDIFFVISGFVIVHASAGLFARRGGQGRFLRRRLTRIVPLYWLLTSLFLATLLLQPSAIRGAIGGAGMVVASYLFVPWPRPDGLVEPAFGLGWTLNYEMFFYVLMTPFLLLRRGWAVAGCGALLCLLVTAGQVAGFDLVQLKFWSDPIVLEFVLGMALSLAVAAGLRLPGWLRLGMAGLALAALHLEPAGGSGWRVVSFGVPGLLLLAAAVSPRSPGQPLGRPMRMLVRLGDASYAMYLFHPFVMRGLTAAGSRFGTHSETGGIVYVAVSMVAAQVCALVINGGLERKLTAALRPREKPSRALSPGGTSSLGSSC